VPARAEAQRAARGEGPLPEEGFEEGSIELTTEDLRSLSQSTRPLPTAVERQMLQEVVDDVSTRLLLDPHEAAKYISRPNLLAVYENPATTNMLFGQAVEKAAAERLGQEPALQRFLHTPQRPGVSTPDIGLPIGRTGPRAADITTSHPQAIAAHEARSYAPFTEWVTYPSLPQGWRFPPPTEVLGR
jgi:hypothetical protein